MKRYKLNDFTGGWFIGDFEPSLVKTKDFEVAVKTYKKGDREKAHFHKVAAEFTLVVVGRCRLNDEVFEAGEIAWIKLGETVEFEALEDTVNTVVKIPSVKGDKYDV